MRKERRFGRLRLLTMVALALVIGIAEACATPASLPPTMSPTKGLPAPTLTPPPAQPNPQIAGYPWLRLAYDSVREGAEADRLAGRKNDVANGFRLVAIQLWMRNTSDSWQLFRWYLKSFQFRDSKGGTSPANWALPLGHPYGNTEFSPDIYIPPTGSIWVVLYGQIPAERQVAAVTLNERQVPLGDVTSQRSEIQHTLLPSDGMDRLATRSQVQCAGQATLSVSAYVNTDGSVSVPVTITNDGSQTRSASDLIYGQVEIYQLDGAFGIIGDINGRSSPLFTGVALPPDQKGSQTLTLGLPTNAVTDLNPPYILFSSVRLGYGAAGNPGKNCDDYVVLKAR